MSAIWDMMIRTRLKIPELPGTYETRVFIGGAYDPFIQDLRKIASYIKCTGFEPIIAFDIKNVPKEKIHDFDISLIKLCKYAIFEVSVGNGHMMEIEAATKYLGTVVFTIYRTRSPKHRKVPSQVSTMLTTLGVPMIPYSSQKKLEEIIQMIFPKISEDPDSTWHYVIKKSQLSRGFKSWLLAFLEYSVDNLKGGDG